MTGGRPLQAAFGVAFVAMLALTLPQDPEPFHYDSGVYWNLGQTFVANGAFSLLNFESPLRGYLLPLIDYGLGETADGFGWHAAYLVKTFNALVLALIATVLAPALARLIWPEQTWGFWRRLGLAALFVVFWGPYLSFPLSDFPALAAALLALVAAGRSEAPGWLLVAGLASAAAINLRPAYIVVVPIVFGLIGFAWWTNRDAPNASSRRRAVGALLLLLGFVAISLPQSLATHRHHERWSFVPGAAANLSTLQFTEGMRLQRYETFVGEGEPGPSMRYADPTGLRILEQRGDETVESFTEYLGIVARHPLDMTKIFAKHAINGLDQRYPTPYVERLATASQPWLRLSGFLLVFIALARLAVSPTRRGLGPTRWRYLVALLLCAAPAVVSAVETRFVLPAYLAAYLLVLAPGWPSRFPRTQSVRARVLAASALIASLALYTAVVLHVTDGATEQLHIV